MGKNNIGVAPELNKISEIIDKDGNKLDRLGKGAKIIEYKKVFNMSDLDINDTPLPEALQPKSSLSDKIEKKINDKINEMLDKKIDEIFSKMF